MDHPFGLGREMAGLREQRPGWSRSEEVGEAKGRQASARAGEEIAPAERRLWDLHGGLVHKLELVGEQQRLGELGPRVRFRFGLGGQPGWDQLERGLLFGRGRGPLEKGGID